MSGVGRTRLNQLKRSIFLFACALGAAGYFLFEEIEEPAVTVGSPVLGDEEADYYGEGITYLQYGADGKLQQQLQSQSTEHFPNAQITQFAEPLINSTSKSGQVWRIEADSGELKDKEQLVTLTNQVKIQPLNPKPGNELLLTTDSLTYHLDTQLARTEAAVEITNPSSQITAIGMQLRVPDELLTLNQQVKTHYAPPPRP